jgi:hypothetical protein
MNDTKRAIKYTTLLLGITIPSTVNFEIKKQEIANTNFKMTVKNGETSQPNIILSNNKPFNIDSVR